MFIMVSNSACIGRRQRLHTNQQVIIVFTRKLLQIYTKLLITKKTLNNKREKYVLQTAFRHVLQSAEKHVRLKVYPLAGIRSHVWWPFDVNVVTEVSTWIHFTHLQVQHICSIKPPTKSPTLCQEWVPCSETGSLLWQMLSLSERHCAVTLMSADYTWVNVWGQRRRLTSHYHSYIPSLESMLSRIPVSLNGTQCLNTSVLNLTFMFLGNCQRYIF